MHEKEAKEQLLRARVSDLEARVSDTEARYAAELRAEQLKRELAERTVAWLKERGTLTMRGVLGECLHSEMGHTFSFRTVGVDFNGQCLSYQDLVGILSWPS